MAGDAVVGALRVVLGTDTAQFEDGLKSAASGLKSFASSAAEVAAGIELQKLFEEAAKAIFELGKQSVETAAQMGRFSQQLGVSTEFISGLSVAATLADVGIETLARGIAHLDKAITSVATGSVGPAASAFRYLGISLKDIKTSSPEEVLNKIADAFQKLPDGASKTAVASALFGDRLGRQLIPVLNEGSHGLEEMRQKAEALGLVFNQQVSKDSERLMQNLRLLGTIVQGIANIVAGVFVKSWADNAEAMTNWVTEGKKAVETGKAIALVLQFLYDNSHLLALGLSNLTPLLTRLFTGKALIDLSAFDKSFKEMNDTVNASLAGFKSLEDVLARKKPYDPEEAAKARQYSNEIANLTLKTQDLYGKFLALPTGFSQAALATGQFKQHMDLANASVQDLAKRFPDLVKGLQDLQVAQIKTEMLTPWEKYQRAMVQLRTDLKNLGEDSDEFKFKQIKNWAEMANAYAMVASSLVGGFAQLFQALGAHSKKAFEIGKALGIAQATIDTFAAATKALAIYGPTPIGYAMMAGAIASGLAQVIKISQTQYTGAAQGGTFAVPGGSMGVDTKMVSMALAPGELVKVTPADQAKRGGNVQTIQMAGIKPNDLFTGDMVRSMFNALNRGYSDGYRVKFA